MVHYLMMGSCWLLATPVLFDREGQDFSIPNTEMSAEEMDDFIESYMESQVPPPGGTLIIQNNSGPPNLHPEGVVVYPVENSIKINDHEDKK